VFEIEIPIELRRFLIGKYPLIAPLEQCAYPRREFGGWAQGRHLLGSGLAPEHVDNRALVLERMVCRFGEHFAQAAL
jgi:hypothetical protein